MTVQWTLAAFFLYTEMGVLLLFCLPFISPKRWNAIFNSRVVATVFEFGNFYFNVVVIVMALLLADSVRETMKYNKFDVTQQDLKNNPQSEMMMQMKLFRAQRNLYISGFSLFLLIVLRRVVRLLSSQSVLEASNEASLRQAQNVSQECERLMTENKRLKKAVEGTGEKPDKVADDEDKVNEELKQLRQALENKSKELAEKTEDLEKTKKDLQALKEQAAGITREYDRLLDEHSKVQAQLEKDETQTSEVKKDN